MKPVDACGLEVEIGDTQLLGERAERRGRVVHVDGPIRFVRKSPHFVGTGERERTSLPR